MKKNLALLAILLSIVTLTNYNSEVFAKKSSISSKQANIEAGEKLAKEQIGQPQLPQTPQTQQQQQSSGSNLLSNLPTQLPSGKKEDKEQAKAGKEGETSESEVGEAPKGEAELPSLDLPTPGAGIEAGAETASEVAFAAGEAGTAAAGLGEAGAVAGEAAEGVSAAAGIGETLLDFLPMLLL